MDRTSWAYSAKVLMLTFSFSVALQVRQSSEDPPRMLK